MVRGAPFSATSRRNGVVTDLSIVNRITRNEPFRVGRSTTPSYTESSIVSDEPVSSAGFGAIGGWAAGAAARLSTRGPRHGTGSRGRVTAGRGVALAEGVRAGTAPVGDGVGAGLPVGAGAGPPVGAGALVGSGVPDGSGEGVAPPPKSFPSPSVKSFHASTIGLPASSEGVGRGDADGWGAAEADGVGRGSVPGFLSGFGAGFPPGFGAGFPPGFGAGSGAGWPTGRVFVDPAGSVAREVGQDACGAGAARAGTAWTPVPSRAAASPIAMTAVPYQMGRLSSRRPPASVTGSSAGSAAGGSAVSAVWAVWAVSAGSAVSAG